MSGGTLLTFYEGKNKFVFETKGKFYRWNTNFGRIDTFKVH